MAADQCRRTGKAVGADLLPQGVRVVAARGPTLAPVRLVGRQDAGAALGTGAFGEAARLQEAAHRLVTDPEVRTDGAWAQPLLLQGEYLVVASEPACAVFRLLLLGAGRALWQRSRRAWRQRRRCRVRRRAP